MADVEVTYRGQIIRSMSASGTEVLHTEGKLCDDDITIDYTSPGGGGANLQTKSVTYTPDETGISDTILPDPGYDGMDEVDVTVTAIPDTYIGSAVPQRSSADLSVMGRTVTAPAGYYSLMAAAQVAAGTAGTPTASKGAVSNHSVDVTPSVTNTTGYINGGTTTGTPVTVSASELVSGDLAITANGNNIDVTNYETVSVNVSGGGGSELKVTTGTSTNVSLSGTFPDLETIEITAGSSGSARYLSAFNMYGAVFTQGVDILYKNFLSLTATAGTASYDFYRTVRNIKSVDYGGATLPNSLQRFWYNAENSNSANWIQHTTYIKGLIWDNVTTMSSCFQANNDYDTQVTKGQYIDIDFGTSEISGNLNFAPAANYFRYTHDTLISLIGCLKNGVSGTVKIGQKNLDTLSAAEIAVATAKGWTISA